MTPRPLKRKLLDLYVLGASLFSILVGLLMAAGLLYAHVGSLKPYVLYAGLVLLGLVGILFYRKENAPD